MCGVIITPLATSPAHISSEYIRHFRFFSCSLLFFSIALSLGQYPWQVLWIMLPAYEYSCVRMCLCREHHGRDYVEERGAPLAAMGAGRALSVATHSCQRKWVRRGEGAPVVVLPIVSPIVHDDWKQIPGFNLEPCLSYFRLSKGLWMLVSQSSWSRKQKGTGDSTCILSLFVMFGGLVLFVERGWWEISNWHKTFVVLNSG